MKKIVRTLCLVAMVALVATSCKKKEENANVTVALEETTGFEAGPSIDGSKAWIDVFNGSVFRWNEHDQVAFYNLSSNPANSTCTVLTAIDGSEGQMRTKFTGPAIGPAQEIGYFVFYQPEKAGAVKGNPLGADNRETFTVPATQDYNPQYMIDPKSMVMACSTPTATNFSLSHIFGFLNIGIYNSTGTSDVEVDYITVEDKANYLAGNVNLKLGEVNPTELNFMLNRLVQYGENDPNYQAAYTDYIINTLGYNVIRQSQTITLNCDAKLNKSGYTYFFISLRPGALRHAFTVTIHYKDGTTYSHEFNNPSEYIIKPGHFSNIYAVTDGRWYVNGQWKY
jgi:hypothetical protein